MIFLRGLYMTGNKKISVQSITDLATQLAGKELADGEKHPEETLAALGAVAKLLEKHAGGHQDIKNLASQVQELVKSNSTK
jgi:hypothetical protein